VKLNLILLLCILANVSIGQKIALLSVDFKKPIIYTDSVTVEQINSGYFTVGADGFDTLYANLKYLEEMLRGRSRTKMESFELRAGGGVLTTTKSTRAYGDHYDIVASSKFGEVASSILLTPAKKNKQNAERINNLMKYIANNRTFFKSPNEVHPKFYNVVIDRE
jgi:hypothetical protein